MREDISDHILSEKENVLTSGDDIVNKVVVGRAINEIWCSKHEVTQSRRQFQRHGKSCRLWGYHNLQRKDIDLNRDFGLSIEEQWNSFGKNVMEKRIPWHLKANNESFTCISLVRLTDFFCNGQRTVIEIIFTKGEDKIDVEVKNNERTVEINLIVEKLEHMSLIEKAVCLTELLDKTAMCYGITHDKTIDPELIINTNAKPVNVRNFSGDSREEDRIFSNECQTLTNTKGECCSSCSKLKLLLYRKVKRRELGGHVLKPSVNHRYMTKADLVGRLVQERKARLKEKRLRLKMEQELLELDHDDHKDITNIFPNTDKADIPEDMDVLWQQQANIKH